MPSLGVCSWSLHPANVHELIDRVRATGLTSIQLALTPIAERQPGWDEAETVAALDAAGITVLSGMLATIGEDYSTLETIRQTGGVRPDQHWEANLARATKVADTAKRLGIKLVTFHAGFLPHDHADPLHAVMINRLRTIGRVFGDHGIAVAFETGQESADTLVEVMRELDEGTKDPHMGVNFDPANMILYGMGDPIRSLELLAPWVLQVHIKDAQPTTIPGTWGTEMPVGRGRVYWGGFFKVLNSKLPNVDTVIEREAGEKRVEDINAAAATVLAMRPSVKWR
ncbi:MAG: sugar phosphate isomerase/epimerase family protein [Phycisphaerales bacterium]